MAIQLIEFIRQHHEVTDNDAALIAAFFGKKIFREGDYLFHPNHICRSFFFICDGVLRIVMHNEKGIEVTHYFLRTAQFCTILNSFENEVVAEEAIQASCDTEVMAIEKNKLYELYTKIPWLETVIDQITQQALIDKIQLRNAYLGLDSADRYQLFITRQPEVAAKVPLNEIASYLDITPQSLSRIRRQIRTQSPRP